MSINFNRLPGGFEHNNLPVWQHADIGDMPIFGIGEVEKIALPAIGESFLRVVRSRNRHRDDEVGNFYERTRIWDDASNQMVDTMNAILPATELGSFAVACHQFGYLLCEAFDQKSRFNVVAMSGDGTVPYFPRDFIPSEPVTDGIEAWPVAIVQTLRFSKLLSGYLNDHTGIEGREPPSALYADIATLMMPEIKSRFAGQMFPADTQTHQFAVDPGVSTTYMDVDPILTNGADRFLDGIGYIDGCLKYHVQVVEDIFG